VIILKVNSKVPIHSFWKTAFGLALSTHKPFLTNPLGPNFEGESEGGNWPFLEESIWVST